jgi:hypothetical protein
MRDDRPARRWGRLAVFGAVGFLAAVGALLAWTRVTASPGYCASCHSMEAASASAADAVHAQVPCLACHGDRRGAVGAVSYVPTLAREFLAQVAGRPWANGILPAATCTTCHTDLGPPPGTAERARHPGPESACASCHGEVAHRVGERSPVSPDDRHPPRYIQIHGRDAVRAEADASGSCAGCHEPVAFCEACHFRTEYPHEGGWIEQHGTVSDEVGAAACTLCHSPRTFCEGCHGTEIPHAPTWLGEHYRQLQDASDRPCAVCHAPTDCTNCHTRHDKHRGGAVSRRSAG